MRRSALATLLLAAPLAAAAEAASDLDRQLALLLAWFPGEWDNHEQHWQQAAVDKRDKPIERIHHVFVPVSVPAVGEHVFFVRQTLDDDPDKVFLQRLYAFSKNPPRGAIQMTIHSFKDEAKYADAWRVPAILEGLSKNALETRPGCEVYWTLQVDHFAGSMDSGACRFLSPSLGKEIVGNDTSRLSFDELWISDSAKDAMGRPASGNPDGVPHRSRKVRYFEGWAAIKRGGKDAPADSRDWIGMRGILLHNEGDRVQVVDADGKPVGYTVELARLTYQNTRAPILKLGVIDDATGKTVAYTWNEPDGTRLGINLGWFQAGVTQRKERVHFGW